MILKKFKEIKNQGIYTLKFKEKEIQRESNNFLSESFAFCFLPSANFHRTHKSPSPPFADIFTAL
jgi:hypothetical protein